MTHRHSRRSHLILAMPSSVAGRSLWRSSSLLLFLFSFLLLFLHLTEGNIDCRSPPIGNIDFRKCMGEPIINKNPSGHRHDVLSFGNATQLEFDNFFAYKPKIYVKIYISGNKEVKKVNLSHVDLNTVPGIIIWQTNVEEIIFPSITTPSGEYELHIQMNNRLRSVNLGRHDFTTTTTEDVLISSNPSLDQLNASFSGNKKIERIHIFANGRLSPANIPPLPDANRKKIQKSGECGFGEDLHDASLISNCTTSDTHIIFGKHATGEVENAHFQKIPGCFKVNETNLTSVSFFVGTATESYCTNVIINNPFICDDVDVDKNYPMDRTKFSLIVKDNCQACTLNGPMIDLSLFPFCPRFKGDLIIDSKTVGIPAKKIKRIYGCFNIKGTNRSSLDFLHGTKTNDDCTNVIEDNIYLKDVDLLVQQVKTAGGKVTVKNNSACALTAALTSFDKLKNPLCPKFSGDLVLGKGFKDEPGNVSVVELEGCYHVNDTDLKTVSFIYGTKTGLHCTNEIKNNRLLCDTVEVGRRLQAWTRLETEMNCENVCYTDDERQVKDCRESYGEVPFEDLKKIRRIHGALVIQKTKNATIDFSLFSHVHYDRLVFRNNEFLCDMKAVEAAAEVEVRFEDNCWHECFSTGELQWKDCTVFNGDIYLRTGTEELGLVTKLEEIKGRLVIEGTDIEEISWKALKKVNTKEEGPAILIQHNRRLKKVNLRGLREVTSRKNPWIKIVDNGEFKFTTKQWRRIMKKTGARIRFQLIVDAHPMENGNKIYYPNVVFKTPKLDEAKVNRFKYTCYVTMVLEALICLYCTWWIKRWCDRETLREQFGELHGF